MSKSLNDLQPYVEYLANKFLEKCASQNFPVVIYYTLRTIQEQNNLYAQGRTKPGKIVTNAKGGQSYHNYGLAFDAAPLVNGQIDWNNEALYRKMGSIGQSVGLEWGGSWVSFKDTPHFQWSGGLDINELIRGKRPVPPANYDKNTTQNPAPSPAKDTVPNNIKYLGFTDTKKFQQVMGLNADGIVGPRTNEAVDAINKKPLCKKGSVGFSVRYIQYKVGANITGTFDDATLAMVKKWQTNKKLTPDGMVGPNSWKNLI